jgi:N-acetylglucosaminyl-diphospho-decaprenol L-rhamnosyltransferase
VSYCAIVIIGFRCSSDIAECLTSLKSLEGPDHAVHICENGGDDSYNELCQALSELGEEIPSAPQSASPGFLTREFHLAGKKTRVFAHRAPGNLGYAGGINAVLAYLKSDPNWDSIWILNPDTAPEPDALAALKRRAVEGGYGIVGSRIVLSHNQRIQMYAGRWRRWMARGWNIGLGEPADATPDTAKIEAEMQYVSGASMYVTRQFIEVIGPMEEGYFLYAEEVDWCLRRGQFKIGYAHESIVLHDHGATIGSNSNRKMRSSFSVFLDERSKLLLTRRFYPLIFPIVAIVTLILTTQYAVQGAYKNFGVALAGWFSGLKGEKGFPKRFAPPSRPV